MPDGFLPVMSVDTEEEARSLLVLSCPRNEAGEFVARDLVEEQTLENLETFSAKLEANYKILKDRKI